MWFPADSEPSAKTEDQLKGINSFKSEDGLNSVCNSRTCNLCLQHMVAETFVLVVFAPVVHVHVSKPVFLISAESAR